MKTAQDVYVEYNIMPSLQLHQLRVAAVAKLICDNFDPPAGGAFNTRDIILACLFHDMGNIIKSNLDIFPDFLEPEGREYWEKVKADFIAKYGNDAHKANVFIATTITLPEGVVALIDGVGFSRLADILASDSLELKIVEYADTRVGPHGTLSLKDRVDEGRKRYALRVQKEGLPNKDQTFQVFARSAQKLEEQIFADTHIRPEDINDAAVAPLIEELRGYPVA